MTRKQELYAISARMRYIEKEELFEITVEEKNMTERVSEEIKVETEEEGLATIRRAIGKMQIYNELMEREEVKKNDKN